MRAIGKPMLLPVVLILLGLGQLIYGVGFHVQPVLTEQEAEAPPPRPFAPVPPPFQSSDDALEDSGEVIYYGEPPLPPAPPLEPEIVTIQETEPHLIKDVTVGGVIRLASGELKRTYRGDAQPLLCPT